MNLASVLSSIGHAVATPFQDVARGAVALAGGYNPLIKAQDQAADRKLKDSLFLIDLVKQGKLSHEQYQRISQAGPKTQDFNQEINQAANPGRFLGGAATLATLPALGLGATIARQGIRPLGQGGFAQVADPLAALRAQLPKGYTIDKLGSVYSPAGKELTAGEIQTLTQPKYLSYYESASNLGTPGGKKGMDIIAKMHPTDARVHIHEPKLPQGRMLQQRLTDIPELKPLAETAKNSPTFEDFASIVGRDEDMMFFAKTRGIDNARLRAFYEEAKR